MGLTGPRQSGKSTLLLHTLPTYRYVNFDDYKIMRFFEEDPEKFMAIHDNQVIFDEIQKVPRLFDYVKIAVDQDRENPGKFVLTSSSQFRFIRGVTESLAGWQAVYLKIMSLQTFTKKSCIKNRVPNYIIIALLKD